MARSQPSAAERLALGGLPCICGQDVRLPLLSLLPAFLSGHGEAELEEFLGRERVQMEMKSPVSG